MTAPRDVVRAVRANRNKAAGERERVLPPSITSRARRANLSYADRVLAGQEPLPDKGSLEAKNLARLAAQARWGKANSAYEAAFKGYWYHNKEDARTEDDPEVE